MPSNSPQHIHIATALAIALLCGCAASHTTPPTSASAATTPVVGRFVAPTARADGDTWLGSYSGTADIYLAESNSWQRATPIQLFVQADGDEKLRILGHMALSASRSSFYLAAIDPSPTRLIAGTYSEQGPLATNRYDYSLTRAGDAITGFVKMHQRSGVSDVFTPGDEWHFSAERSALPGFR